MRDNGTSPYLHKDTLGQARKRLVRERVLDMLAQRKAERIARPSFSQHSTPRAQSSNKPAHAKNLSNVSPSSSMVKDRSAKKFTAVLNDPSIKEIQHNYQSLMERAGSGDERVTPYESKEWDAMVADLSKQFAHIKLLQLRSKFCSPPKKKPEPLPITSVHDKCVLPSNIGEQISASKTMLKKKRPSYSAKKNNS
eukprot:TRINITY_DN8497_c0_g1_i2.p1 TRINITY_DN8497_c0_g1~~TRINITY_DN8497_c0_g1_i2.p1  ORF type:complete len:195 (-),score=27.10 TRINITY_DN8497_c0_g1_i2:158-742(-)